MPQTVQEPSFWEKFTNWFVDNPFVTGLLILIGAFLIALIAKIVVVSILNKTKLGAKLNKAGISYDTIGSTVQLIGKLTFVIVFLLFLPAALTKMSLGSVTGPITNMVDTMIGCIPNIIAAGIILFIGTIIADAIRQILGALLARTKLNKIQETAGTPTSITFSALLSYIAFILILIPVIIAALSVLGIEAISVPAIGMLNAMFAAVPSIVLALVLVAVGIFLASLACALLSAVLVAANLDGKVNAIIGGKKPIAMTRIITEVVKYLIIVLFVVQALSSLNLGVLSNVGTAIIAYLPNVLAAMIVAVAAFVGYRIVENKLGDKCRMGATATKVAIVTVAAFFILSQLGIASTLVNTAFTVILGAAGVAAALAFGLGGREFAAKLLNKINIDKK
ncbi:MAG: hypothetical protein E7616_04770 [Ruminococcaceae bacterium]|nr:hypothetical protein [Oscillospiraceae bacterium]